MQLADNFLEHCVSMKYHQKNTFFLYISFLSNEMMRPAFRERGQATPTPNQQLERASDNLDRSIRTVIQEQNLRQEIEQQ